MRSAAMLTLAGLLGLAGLWRTLGRTSPAVPLACDGVVALEENGDVRLACPDDAALRGCPDVKPGRRYRSCTETGAVVGPVLAARGQPLSLAAASTDDLRALPDVGRSMARKLDAARRERPLCNAGDLETVPGVGPKKAAKLAAGLEFDDLRCR
jgi:hypothetical protein